MPTKPAKHTTLPPIHRNDRLIVVLRQSGIDPEDEGLTRAKLVWFACATIEHLDDGFEFYNHDAIGFGFIDILPHSCYAPFCSKKIRKALGLAKKYEFLRVYPRTTAWLSIFPEHLRILPPVA